VDLYTCRTFSGKLLSLAFHIPVDPSTSCLISSNIFSFSNSFFSNCRHPPATFLTGDYTVGLTVHRSTHWWSQRRQNNEPRSRIRTCPISPCQTGSARTFLPAHDGTWLLCSGSDFISLVTPSLCPYPRLGAISCWFGVAPFVTTTLDNPNCAVSPSSKFFCVLSSLA